VIISAGGAKVPYARIHNEGGRVRGIQYVRPHDRKRVGGLRKYQVKWHARKVDFQMPRRQFMGFTQELKQSILSRISKL
jgi:phage gpG-like protein